MRQSEPGPQRLTDLEQRLSQWQPAADGGSADAVLYAAGRAVGRAERRVALWAALGLAVVASGLGGWGWWEHAGRRELADQLRAALSQPSATPAQDVVPGYQPATDGYLSLRKRWEQGPEPTIDRPADGAPPPPAPPFAAPVLHAGALRDLPDQ